MARALELIAQQPYKKYIATHILRPLAMYSTAFHIDQEMSNRLATGYYAWDGNTQQEAPNHDIGGFAPTGGLHSSVRDMARFISLHLGDPHDRNGSVLARQTTEQMRVPILETAKPRYVDSATLGGVATGWFLSSIAGLPVFEHGGGDFPWGTFMALVPAVDLGVFIAANTGTNTTALAQMAYNVLGSLIHVGD